MTDPTPTGDDLLPVAELARLAGVTPTYFYSEARAGRAPTPRPAGVPRREALAWLKARAAKAQARAEKLAAATARAAGEA